MKIAAVVAALLLSLIPAAHADETGTTDEAALAKTQQLLKDPAKRAAATRGDPAASAADAQVRGLAKSEADTQAIYDLSAEVLATLVELTGGDPAKMAALLEEAKAHPEKLAEKFTPQQRAKLEQIARQLESSNSSGAPSEKPAK